MKVRVRSSMAESMSPPVVLVVDDLPVPPRLLLLLLPPAVDLRLLLRLSFPAELPDKGGRVPLVFPAFADDDGPTASSMVGRPMLSKPSAPAGQAFPPSTHSSVALASAAGAINFFRGLRWLSFSSTTTGRNLTGLS